MPQWPPPTLLRPGDIYVSILTDKYERNVCDLQLLQKHIYRDISAKGYLATTVGILVAYARLPQRRAAAVWRAACASTVRALSRIATETRFCYEMILLAHDVAGHE